MPLLPAVGGFVEQSKHVSPSCLISFERNRYSVSCSGFTPRHLRYDPSAPCANRPVSLRIYPSRLVVAVKWQIIREHTRVI